MKWRLRHRVVWRPGPVHLPGVTEREEAHPPRPLPTLPWWGTLAGAQTWSSLLNCWEAGSQKLGVSKFNSKAFGLTPKSPSWRLAVRKELFGAKDLSWFDQARPFVYFYPPHLKAELLLRQYSGSPSPKAIHTAPRPSHRSALAREQDLR